MIHFHFVNAVVAVASNSLTASSSASWSSCSPPLNFVNGHTSTIWLIICCCWPQSRRWFGKAPFVRNCTARALATGELWSQQKLGQFDLVYWVYRSPCTYSVSGNVVPAGHPCLCEVYRHRQTDRQTDRHRDKHTYKHTQTDRWWDRQTHTARQLRFTAYRLLVIRHLL